MRNQIHLLLVEDNPGDVFLVREALRHCSTSVDVTIAGDGQLALTLLSEGFKPDLIILDLNIPKLDGFAVLERIGRGTAPIAVFTCSADGTDRALALGAREVVQKPSEFPAFVEAVCKIVGM